MGIKITNHRILPMLDDKNEYLYIEKAIIEQDDSSICIIQGDNATPIPICTISCLILGPGTSITHRAIQAISESRCIIIWSGENLRSFYAVGFEKDRRSANLLKQINYYADTNKHLSVIKTMYEMRFLGMKTDGMTLEQMRGLEGLRMKEMYAKYAAQYNIQWNGRSYKTDSFSSQDITNQHLTVGNQLLYNICRAAVYTLGYSPAIGFIHTGHMDSFIYDLADLYKADIVIPTAFKLTSESVLDHAMMRIACCDKMKEIKLLTKIRKDIETLFSEQTNDVVGLWDGESIKQMGVNYDL